MKKIYSLLCVALFSVSAYAQSYQPVTKTKADDSRRGQSAVTIQESDREVFWTNDFSDCSDWSISNANTEGNTDFVTLDFVCGTEGPSGPAAIAGIASTTATNGFMMVDSDEFGGEEGGSGIENCWFQTVEPINCLDHEFVSIAFETQYYMWDGGGSDGNEYCLIEVSTDGVTWPDVTTFEESEAPGMRYECWPEMQTQDPVDNPTVLQFDITEAAGGEETVYLRFRWKGTWGYAWMVDDLEVFDTPENDVRVESYVTYTDYLNVESNLYEYGAFPTSQLTELFFANKVANVGSLDQTGVTMNVTVNGDAAASSTPVDLAYAAKDTLRAQGYTPPATLGMYEVAYDVVMDAEDENPENNASVQSFEVTEYSYGRDDSQFTGVFPADGTVEYIGGTPFQIIADGMVYAIDVAFIDGVDAGTEVTGHILDADLEVIESTSEIAVSTSLTNSGTNDGAVVWQSLVLDEPYEVFAGDFIAAGVEHFGGTNCQIGESKWTYDNTAFVYGDFGTAGFDWYFSNEVPMIRLNFDPNAAISVEERTNDNFAVLQNAPNPATDNTRIVYQLDVAADVTLEVYDITGKLVVSFDQGTQPTGQHNFDLDVTSFSPGMYQYTLVVDGDRATRKMMIK